MEKAFSIKITKLLWENWDTQILSGPHTPFQTAMRVSNYIGSAINRLCRIEFDDPAILSLSDGARYEQVDCLLMGVQSRELLFVLLWVDTGAEGFAIASGASSEIDFQITDVYKHTPFRRKLTEIELRGLFDFVFSHPFMILPRMEGEELTDHPLDGRAWIPITIEGNG